MNWEDLENAVKNCTGCDLCKGRTNVVIGRGNKNATVLFVGEGPGEQEDLEGVPFVGKAGQLFEQCLDAACFDRSEIYIANVVKCRPPENRNPLDEECMACLPFLRGQFALIRPRVVVCMGLVASKTLLRHTEPMNRLRGKWENVKGTLFLTTYHPAALLRNETLKMPFYEDILSVKKVLEEIKNNIL
ncbi:MAG: uracil-DNA glycosylase [Clostridia bacterium]|nr:uracil-DNA glycosylase [Clostridia bacterium]